VYKVALVMIARNEAARIVRALASLRPHVDEMYVLDTGSTDATVELARSAGARVGRFRWVDDFAAARNAALAAVDADWNLVVDADEWLLAGGPGLLELRHMPPDFVGSVRVDSQFDDGHRVGMSPSWMPRLLPAGVRYTGRVHEQPRHTLPVRRVELALGHDGYLGDALRAKRGRNRRLLATSLRQSPRDPYLHYQLGKDHDVYGRWTDAAASFARSRECEGPNGTLPAPGWHHDRAVREIHALKKCGRATEAVPLAEAAMTRWPESPDVFFALGDLLLDWAAREPARAAELLPMIESAWLHCLELGERPENEGAVAGRGSHLAVHNLIVLYEGTGRDGDALRLKQMS